MKTMSNFVNTLFGFIAIMLLGVFLLPAPANAQEQDIMAQLKKRDREIKAVLGNHESFTEAQKSELKNHINGAIDFGEMGRDALGTHWEGLSAEQQSEFIRVFSEIVRGQSLSDLEIYRLEVDYGEIAVVGEDATVTTTTIYKEQPISVVYEMGFRDNQWWVDDIVLDEVSTTEGYARSFQTYIRKRGFDALMVSLNKKLDKMNAAG